MFARVGNDVIEGIVGLFGVIGGYECDERLLELCAEQKLVISNSLFRKKDVYKYTWVRMVEGRVVKRPLIYYVLLDVWKTLRYECV